MSTSGRTFSYRHLIFDKSDADYKEFPLGKINRCYEQWYITDYILKLEVGETIDTDFRRIKRET